jgi:Arc/MetJ-type ribon-helix-helix transcriptional regulator
MANTVNISLPPTQRAWLEGRRQTGQFTSTSDVVQDLIRQAQEAEQQRLRAEFDELSKSSGANPDAEPEAVVTRAAKSAKRRNRLDRRGT